MKVCYTTHKANLTGANRSLCDILAHLDRGIVSPLVVVGEKGPLTKELDNLGVEWHLIPYRPSLRNMKGQWWRNAAKGVMWHGEVKRLAAFMSDAGVELVHNNSLYADAAMASAHEVSIPCICHIREFVSEDHGLTLFDEERTSRLAAECVRAIAISDAVAAKFSGWFEDGQLLVLRNGVDARRYRIDHQEVLAGGECHLLLAGNIAEGKGQIDAIRAVAELRNRGITASLVIVGRPSGSGYAGECEREADALHVRDLVQMREFVDDLTELKSRADISLTCSRSEALGRVTIEGMLAGCLVIGGDAGATPEIIDDGRTGLLYDVGNPVDLADKVGWAIGNPRHANAIAKAGQDEASIRYDIDAYVRRLVDLYREVLDAHVA